MLKCVANSPSQWQPAAEEEFLETPSSGMSGDSFPPPAESLPPPSLNEPRANAFEAPRRRLLLQLGVPLPSTAAVARGGKPGHRRSSGREPRARCHDAPQNLAPAPTSVLDSGSMSARRLKSNFFRSSCSSLCVTSQDRFAIPVLLSPPMM